MKREKPIDNLTACSIAADKACQVLLFRLERNKWGEQVYLHRSEMGGITIKERRSRNLRKKGSIKSQ